MASLNEEMQVSSLSCRSETDSGAQDRLFAKRALHTKVVSSQGSMILFA